ncbi:MAG: DinB family protein [Acidobacteriaceae bacterium]
MADTGKSLGRQLRRELIALLDGGQAHATFDEALKDFPVKLRGTVPEGLPYSGWQIVEHLRIAQRDILDFSNNSEGNYKSLKWPDDYWPKAAAPPSEKAWDDSLKQIRADRKVFDKLLQDADDAELVKSFEWGDRQTVLREALLIADHNAYHTGELVVVRRLLGAWKK